MKNLIYLLNVNENIYIGSTKNTLNHRLEQHINGHIKYIKTGIISKPKEWTKLCRCIRNRVGVLTVFKTVNDVIKNKQELYNSVLSEIKPYILEFIPTTEKLEIREQYYIDLYDSINTGLNMKRAYNPLQDKALFKSIGDRRMELKIPFYRYFRQILSGLKTHITTYTDCTVLNIYTKTTPHTIKQYELNNLQKAICLHDDVFREFIYHCLLKMRKCITYKDLFKDNNKFNEFLLKFPLQKTRKIIIEEYKNININNRYILLDRQ